MGGGAILASAKSLSRAGPGLCREQQGGLCGWNREEGGEVSKVTGVGAGTESSGTGRPLGRPWSMMREDGRVLSRGGMWSDLRFIQIPPVLGGDCTAQR